MADHADEHGGGNIFVYRWGRAPQHVTHVLIHTSVEVIEENAFSGNEHLVQVETHNGIRSVETRAFYYCKSLRRINLQHAREIGRSAFFRYENLTNVEFGRLETIRSSAFGQCRSLESSQAPIRHHHRNGSILVLLCSDGYWAVWTTWRTWHTCIL